MGQQSTSQAASSSSISPIQQNQKSRQKIQHKGILKIRSTPFPHCRQIYKNNSILFIQNTQTTLHHLLQSRLYTNRLFPLQDIQLLIQNVSYVLGDLCQCDSIYRDLSTKNIYYSSNHFKLLPDELIEQTAYEQAWQQLYISPTTQQHSDNLPYLSPQLIIALRMKQKIISDTQILDKSCVFTFGMILLQTTTLMPSFQCYDSNTYDIFSTVISERLELVREFYNQCISNIIAHMINYDFNQRINLRELSILVTRELMGNKDHAIRNNEFRESYQQKYSIQQNKFPTAKLIQNNHRKVAKYCEEDEIQQDKIKTSPFLNSAKPNFTYVKQCFEENNTDNICDPQFITLGGPKCSPYLKHTPFSDANLLNDKPTQLKHKQPSKQKNSIKPPLHHQYLPLQSKPTTSSYLHQYTPNKRNLTPQQKKSKHYQNYQQNRQIQTLPSCFYNNKQIFLANITNNMKQTPHHRVSKQKLKNTHYKQQHQHFHPLSSTNESKSTTLQNIYPQSQPSKHVTKNKKISHQKQQQFKFNQNNGSINRIKMQIQKSKKFIQEFRNYQ